MSALKKPQSLYRTIYFVVSLIAFIISATASAAVEPTLFFTDIESGPNSGGKDNLGAFITLYGEGFGTTRSNSTVTIGGHEVAQYVMWGENNAPARNLDMIVVQPGPDVPSGNIVVTVNGSSSNPLPFTVRSGNIFFVIPNAANANDANPGTDAAPFKTLYRPRQSLQAGDIVYIKGGTFSEMDPGNPGWDAILILDSDTAANGTPDRPIAYIGYPGDRPVLGNPAARRGILLDTTEQPRNYYVLANMMFTQSRSPLPVTGIGHRVVGNYLYDGAFDDSGTIGVNGNSSRIKILGNLLRNNGTPDVKFHHGVYIGGFGTNQEIEVGWNQIQDQHGGRGIQLFGHVDGDIMDNIRIHDNLISGSELNNIVLGGSDGNTEVLGTVYVYNNIITGSGNPGLRVDDPQGRVFIFNNVLYNNGAHAIFENEHAQMQFQRCGAGLITLQNNIVYAESGETYVWVDAGVDPATFKTGNNLWFNAGVAPAWDLNLVNVDPMFMNTAAGDFRLKKSSPAINAGINTGIDRDYMGIPRNSNYDIGAHEFNADMSVGVDWQEKPVNDFILNQNYPNPFNSSTAIRFTLIIPANVQINIYDLMGKRVCTLLNEVRRAGIFSVNWNGKDQQGVNVASGVYYYQISDGKTVYTKKMLFVQ